MNGWRLWTWVNISSRSASFYASTFSRALVPSRRGGCLRRLTYLTFAFAFRLSAQYFSSVRIPHWGYFMSEADRSSSVTMMLDKLKLAYARHVKGR